MMSGHFGRLPTATYRPLLDAIDAIQRNQGGSRQYFMLSEIAVDDVTRPKWRDIVVENAPDGSKRVNHINYFLKAWG